MDTKPLEIQAESYIKSQLLKYNFNVIKPIFDENGSDLIIVDNIENNLWHYINIQSKGRTVSIKNTNISIPVSYVNNQFYLYIQLIVNSWKNYLFFLKMI